MQFYLLPVMFILHCVNHPSNSVSRECLQCVVMLSSANMSKTIHEVYRPMNDIRILHNDQSSFFLKFHFSFGF